MNDLDRRNEKILLQKLGPFFDSKKCPCCDFMHWALHPELYKCLEISGEAEPDAKTPGFMAVIFIRCLHCRYLMQFDASLLGLEIPPVL